MNDVMKNICLLLIVIFSTVTSGFPSSPMTGWNDVYTRTHRDMLNSGLKKATGNYLKNKYLEDDLSNVPLREVVNVFFGNDSDGRKKYDESVDNIFISLEKQEMLSEPHFHCNAEQFLEAHTYIIYLRNIISELAKDGDPNIALLQEYIGKILYTLQSFYSSSNWVEMDGNKTYRDFGVPGKTIIPIAADDVDTCSDCDNSGKFTDSCKDNLLLTNMLTSGYHSKQDILPPRRSAGATSGKCGFGGSSDDNNGVTTARGGLNKDQDNPSYSPHHHLHYNAYSAANEATFQFFIDPEIGIINELTNEVFGTLFQLHRREKGSLGFAIDVTGSMSDEIAEVKKYCIDYITTIRGTTNEPTDYILTTFSDPESQTELVIKTNDGIEMITAINSLGLQSGGDCPEHAMDGLEACIQACQPYSTILVFTDADAKDKSRKDFVINFAVKASITVDFVLTGKCERKRRSTDRYKRLTSIFDDIAYATGGNVYRITTSEIFTVMKTVIEERFPSASAIIDTITFEKTSNTNVTFNVDSFVQNIRIEITGPYDTLEVDLTYSGDSIIESGLATVFFYPPNTVIITAIRPTSGNYTVQRKIVRDWLINITAQTNLDFKYYILEQYDNGNWYRTSANPAFSESYIIQVVVYDTYVNVSLLEIILTDNNGCKEHLNVTLISSEDTIGVYAKAFFTSEEYQVSIAGYDAVGNEFIRTSSKKIRAVTVKLQTVSPTELFAGAITTIAYSLTNTGTNNDTFVVSFIDNRGFLTGPSTASHTLSNGVSVSGSFKMQSQSTCKTVTYELNVQPFGSNVVLQKESKSVFVSLNSPPSCIIYNVVGNCSRQFKEGVCLSNMWYGQAILTFDSALRYVKGTPRLNIEIGSQNLSSSPFYVNASGDCCTPTSYVTAIDTNNYMIKCSFNLGEPIYLSRSQPNVSEEAKLAVGVISGIILLVIIVTICIVILIFRVGVKPKLEARKIHDMTVKACSNLPARSENIAKERFNGSYSVLTADSLSVQFT